jgi:hypothetical protein
MMKIDTIIDSYQDYKPSGTWDSVVARGDGAWVKENDDFHGQMFERTVKVRRSDGVIALEIEWLTDEEVANEIRGNE